MQKIILYHNQRCGKSRGALALLEARGIIPEVRYYLQDPPAPDELKALVAKLNIPAEALVRKNEPLYKEKYKGKELSENQWIGILSEHPVLLERPVVVWGEDAIIARPPEKVLAWLDRIHFPK